MRRKIRIACQAFNVHRLLWPQNPPAGALDRYKYVSHKLLRWFSIYTLAGAVLCLALAGIFAGHGAARCCHRCHRRGRPACRVGLACQTVRASGGYPLGVRGDGRRCLALLARPALSDLEPGDLCPGQSLTGRRRERVQTRM